MRVHLLIVLFVYLISLTWAKPRYSSASGNSGATSGGSTHTQEDDDSPPISNTRDDSRGGGKKGEKDLLEDMLRESDVLNMLEAEQKKHEKRLKDLQTRLEKELQQVQEHFESVMLKLKKTEEQLEQNLKNVEKSMVQKLGDSQIKAQSSSSWRWPFFFLLLSLGGLAAFFGRLYMKATKGMRML